MSDPDTQHRQNTNSYNSGGGGFDVESALRRAVCGISSGLLNIRERAALVGGAVTVVSTLGDGACVEVVLPKHAANIPGSVNAGRKDS